MDFYRTSLYNIVSVFCNDNGCMFKFKTSVDGDVVTLTIIYASENIIVYDSTFCMNEVLHRPYTIGNAIITTTIDNIIYLKSGRNLNTLDEKTVAVKEEILAHMYCPTCCKADVCIYKDATMKAANGLIQRNESEICSLEMTLKCKNWVSK